MGTSGRLIVLVSLLIVLLLWNSPYKSPSTKTTTATPNKVLASADDNKLFDSYRYINQQEYDQYFTRPADSFTEIQLTTVKPITEYHFENYQQFVENFEDEPENSDGNEVSPKMKLINGNERESRSVMQQNIRNRRYSPPTADSNTFEDNDTKVQVQIRRPFIDYEITNPFEAPNFRKKAKFRKFIKDIGPFTDSTGMWVNL